MKKYLPIVTLAAAAYGVIFWLRRKAAAGQNLRYQIEDIAIDIPKIVQSRFSRIYFNTKLRLINDESVSVNVRQINLNANVGNRSLGKIINNTPFSVPARSSNVVRIETSFSSGQIVLYIIDKIRNGFVFDDPISLDGYIQTDLGRVNVDYTRNAPGQITGVKRYDLGFAKKGNGTTVYNRNKMQYGDYENVAHISEFGNVTYYKKLPSYAVDMIMAIAASIKGMKENTLKYQGEKPYSTGFIWGTQEHILNNVQGNC